MKMKLITTRGRTNGHVCAGVPLTDLMVRVILVIIDSDELKLEIYPAFFYYF